MTEHKCDNGWIHIQHPLKPPGVIIQSLPCRICNPSGDKAPFMNGIVSFHSIDKAQLKALGENTYNNNTLITIKE